jgi:hypothetical protein
MGYDPVKDAKSGEQAERRRRNGFGSVFEMTIPLCTHQYQK